MSRKLLVTRRREELQIQWENNNFEIQGEKKDSSKKSSLLQADPEELFC